MNKTMKEVLEASAVGKDLVTIRFAGDDTAVGLVAYVGDDYVALNVDKKWLMVPLSKVNCVYWER